MVESSFMGAGSGEGGSWTASFDVAHPMLVEKKREDDCGPCACSTTSPAQIEKKRHKHLTNTGVPGMILGILELFETVSVRDRISR